MSELISRDALVAELRALAQAESNELLSCAILKVMEAPRVQPQVIIDVTGGIADVVATSHYVDVNVMDYDIQDDEQDDYIIDEDGRQAWLYGDCQKPNPELVEKILNYPTVADREDA